MILALLLPTLLPAAVQGEHPREWWYWAVEGSVREIEGRWSEAADSFERAVRQNPDWTHGRFLLGRAAVEARDEGRAQSALELLFEDERFAAHALFQRARLAAALDEPDVAGDFLEASLQWEIYVAPDSLGRDAHLSSLLDDAGFRAFEGRMGSARERFETLADTGDDDGLARLFHCLNLEWIDLESSPAHLVRTTLDDLARLRQEKRRDEARLAALLERARSGGRAGDAVFGGTTWSRWVDAVTSLDPAQGAEYRENWKAIAGTGRLFRSHRFTYIMERYVPLLAIAREHGDTAAVLDLAFVVGLARECLVEYGTHGFDAAEEWRLGWEDFVEVRDLALALGQHSYFADAYENRVEFYAHVPNEALRAELCTPMQIGISMLEMALHDLKLPPTQRRFEDYRNWMESYGVYP